MTRRQFSHSPRLKASHSVAPLLVAWLLSFVLFSIPFAPASGKNHSSAAPLSPIVAFHDVGLSVVSRFSSVKEKQRGQSDEFGFIPLGHLPVNVALVRGDYSFHGYVAPALVTSFWKGVSKRGPPSFL